MNSFNNFGKIEEYIPVVKLSNGKYLVNYNKVTEVTEEKVMKNSRLVGTGKLLPTGYASWKSIIFESKPSVGLIQDTIYEIINKAVSYNIEHGLRWKGYSIHLSLENQMNYKNAFDLAVATSGESLPVTFKFTKAGKTEYYTFDTVEELKSFYLSVNSHINSCLEYGWKEKDKFDPTEYVI